MSRPTTRTTEREVLAGHGRPEDFRHQAACRSVDPEVFFPVAVAGAEFERQVEVAKAVCGGCPVRAACREWALVALPEGIAGGMTEHERRFEQARRHGRQLGTRAEHRRPVRGTRDEVAAAGRAALAAGMSVRDVAGEFLVSPRTAERWARSIRVRPTHQVTHVSTAEGSAGGHRAPLQSSHSTAQAGTRAEGTRG